MRELSNSETALLGLLSEKPMHPYMIEQEVKYRDMRFWTDLSMSSIYKLLRKLEKEGLTERKDIITQENRLKKHYSLTENGEAALKAKISQLLSGPEHMKWQIDIGLHFAHLLSKKEIENCLHTYCTELEKKRKGYLELEQFLKDSDCSKNRLQLAKRPVRLLEAEISWVEEYLNSLNQEDSQL
ncbi:MAG: PadR family transcriptional regulator [Spirochaetia bacterium]